MSTVTLNLARKWRSKSFDRIVGQDLLIRMLKNSLFLGQYFPVYLFAGQRGCGKTTTARVFAAAVNCERLADFRKQPKEFSIPCLECASCQAMAAGKHPDFIEIDAASHTGVDNIRQIIDAASLLPLMGQKKIYLIDEAHMLSKAAFNALLKILEEPPMSVLFILATTDAQKIIETVRSRCFQLFFKPIETTSLYNHLAHVCEAENIKFVEDGLYAIIRESEGSARDALNLLEQVRFSSSVVSKQNVLAVLGHVDDAHIIKLLEIILAKSPHDFIQYLHDISFESVSAEFVWHRLIDVVRAALWAKYGVQTTHFSEHQSALKRLVNQCSGQQLNAILHALYEHESLFLKTKSKHACMEMILLQMLYKKNSNDDSGRSSLVQASVAGDEIESEDDEFEEDEDEQEDEDLEEEEVQQVSPLDQTVAQGATDTRGLPAWDLFAQAAAQYCDPLLGSVIRQGRFINYDAAAQTVEVVFAKDFLFFKDMLDESSKTWLPMLQRSYGAPVSLKQRFEGMLADRVTAQPKAAAPMPEIKTQPRPAASQQSQHAPRAPFKPKSASVSMPSYSKEPAVDVSDVDKWPTATMLMQHFPGNITEIREQ
jgi:DNA polymerase III subunit gamma/tau